MPEDFNRCVRENGDVRTVRPKPGYYMHVCYDKKGRVHKGEIKKKK